MTVGKNTASTPRAAALAAALCAVLLTACGSGGGTVPGDRLPAMKAQDQAEPPVQPVEAPRDTRVLTGDGFTLHAPSAFQQRDSSDTPRAHLVLERPSSSASLPSRVVVLRETAPGSDVVQQAYAAEVTMRTTKGVTDVLRSDLTWPGARRAVLLQWTQDVPAPQGSGGTTRARFWQLNTQITDDLIIAVVAVSPVADFESSGVGTVLSTFRPKG